MEQSPDRTAFPLWRALTLGGFAAAALTAVALFGSPASAHADDGSGAPADPGLLGAVTQVVGSLEQPLDAVADVVDTVDTTVLEPVASVVDDTVASVPVVNDVVEQTLGDAPVAAIVEPVVDVVDQTLTGVGDAVAAVPVPAVPGIDPSVPIEPSTPVTVTPSGEQVAPAQVVVGPPSAPASTGGAATASTFADGYSLFLAGTAGTTPEAAGSAAPPASPAGVPQAPLSGPGFAVTPAGSSSAGAAGPGASGAASDVTAADFLPVLCDDRRGPSRDDDLPSSPTFPSDTSPD